MRNFEKPVNIQLGNSAYLKSFGKADLAFTYHKAPGESYRLPYFVSDMRIVFHGKFERVGAARRKSDAEALVVRAEVTQILRAAEYEVAEFAN
jgi:hypothetical protein